LVKLDLSNNYIKKIEGLEHLTNLEDLNLEMNNIRTIEGLDNLSNLKSLTLYRNEITHVKSFENKDNLEYFLLGSTNPLYRAIKGVFRKVTPQNLRLFTQMSNEQKQVAFQRTREELIEKERKKREREKIQKQKDIKFMISSFIIGVFCIIFGVLATFSMGGVLMPLGITLLIIGFILLTLGTGGRCCEAAILGC